MGLGAQTPARTGQGRITPSWCRCLELLGQCRLDGGPRLRYDFVVRESLHLLRGDYGVHHQLHALATPKEPRLPTGRHDVAGAQHGDGHQAHARLPRDGEGTFLKLTEVARLASRALGVEDHASPILQQGDAIPDCLHLRFTVFALQQDVPRHTHGRAEQWDFGDRGLRHELEGAVQKVHREDISERLVVRDVDIWLVVALSGKILWIHNSDSEEEEARELRPPVAHAVHEGPLVRVSPLHVRELDAHHDVKTNHNGEDNQGEDDAAQEPKDFHGPAMPSPNNSVVARDVQRFAPATLRAGARVGGEIVPSDERSCNLRRCAGAEGAAPMPQQAGGNANVSEEPKRQQAPANRP
mmetsp:Transcript_15867/g.43441  ORF Transcript_15867/g.43441 Transcript_15867/m.43441 type:complete len:354 (+) Transcript_15867:36-1097(+)